MAIAFSVFSWLRGTEMVSMFLGLLFIGSSVVLSPLVCRNALLHHFVEPFQPMGYLLCDWAGSMCGQRL
jgi:hypothetical protein